MVGRGHDQNVQPRNGYFVARTDDSPSAFGVDRGVQFREPSLFFDRGSVIDEIAYGNVIGKFFHAANVILSESERMAEIVRKIGKITRYETKSYVGHAKILDLDKASGESAPDAAARALRTRGS